MNSKYIIAGALGMFVLVGAQAQQGNPTTSGQSPVSGTQPPPAVNNPAENNGALLSSNQLNRFRGNLQSLGTNFSRFGTNAYEHLTNAWTSLSNRFRGTNLTPTSDRDMTNRMYGTNGFSMTNRTRMQMRDEASTPADQTLLVQIRQEIRPLFATGNNRQPWMPVHFVCHDKTVRVVGFVPDEERRQRIITLVKETPGVVQVVDELQVSGNAETAGGDQYEFNQGGQAGNQPAVSQDQASTASDRNILIQVRQEVQPIIGNSSPWMPVHFVCRDGIVTLVGFVPNEQQKQQIFQVVQRTPGVVQVVNQIQVNTTLGAAGGGAMGGTGESGGTNSFGASSTNQAGDTNSLGMGSTNQLRGTNSFGSSMTNAYGANTNLAPTGRTNAGERMYPNRDQDQDQNLPPGLRRQENLPPGLEKKDQLPPGLERRTNSPSSSDSR